MIGFFFYVLSGIATIKLFLRRTLHGSEQY